MPPIPIYTKSPINAAKADGATPQTVESSEKAQPQPATTTATPTEKQGGCPPAQPGAVPSLPAVTQVPSHNYTPLNPTPTTTLPSGGPPPPQPGAVPSLPGATASGTASGPPPPAVTAPAYLPGQGHPPPPTTSTYPHQMHIPPPTVPQQQRGTSSTAFAVPAPGYNTNQGQGADLGHPPGYQQNVQETSSAREDGGYQTAGARPGAHHSSSGWDDGGDGGEEGVWDAAKKWAMAAGDKLSAAEQEVWKRINGKE
ncbi:hypothetical protein GE09DRAFT_1153647 [Coniochaeta sp. 2T2.1]|nr:hypothetical protein GE09DRAFT_1153647 [Coniochaeta sp. 2T2.1]